MMNTGSASAEISGQQRNVIFFGGLKNGVNEALKGSLAAAGVNIIGETVNSRGKPMITCDGKAYEGITAIWSFIRPPH